MRLPSGSSLDRAFACPPSMVYPHLREVGSAHWSRRGSVIHAFLSSVPEVGVERALEAVPAEYREACECIDVEKLPAMDRDAYAFEVAVAWDMEADTARELGRNLTREQAYADRREGELVGTMDVLGITEVQEGPRRAVVLDYKTGYRYFEDIASNPQLLFYALAACRAYQCEGADIGIIRIDQEGRPYFMWASISAKEIDAFAQRLRDLRDEAEVLELRYARGEALAPVTGDHCQYCPAVWRCPAWMELARRMTSPEDDAMGLPELGPETEALYLEALRRGRKVLERMQRAVDLYAEQHPIDEGGGWFYEKHPFPNREWNLAKALPVLTEYLGEAATTCVDAKVVQKSIEGVFRERKKTDKTVTIGKDTARVMEALQAYGGLTIRYSTPISRHKRKPEDAAIMAELASGPAVLTEGEAEGEAA